MEKTILEQIVSAGLRAPTADNCQPFRFRSKDDALLIHFMPERAKAFLDFNHLMSWLSLGCLLTNMKIKARSLGYDFEYELSPYIENGSPIARLVMRETDIHNSPLLPYIEKRCTNRKAGMRYRMPAGDEKVFLNAGLDLPDIRIDVENRPSLIRWLAGYTSKFYPLLLEHKEIHDGLYHWLRWCKEDIDANNDGFHVHALEFTKMVQALLLLSKNWSFSRFLTFCRLTKPVGYLMRRRYKTSAGFILFSIEKNHPESYVNAGQALERVWLEATRLGYSAHPSIGIVSLCLRKRLNDGNGLSNAQRKMLARTEAEISQIFPSFSSRLPVFLLRLSKTPPPSAKTPRLPIPDVLTYQDMEAM